MGDEVETNEEQTMHVIVAGATGAIGRRLAPRLVARGHEVTAAGRTPDKADDADELRHIGPVADVRALLRQGRSGERPTTD
jgi:uncharacterized protein YbjT (DUF2867 family)